MGPQPFGGWGYFFASTTGAGAWPVLPDLVAGPPALGVHRGAGEAGEEEHVVRQQRQRLGPDVLHRGVGPGRGSASSKKKRTVMRRYVSLQERPVPHNSTLC